MLYIDSDPILCSTASSSFTALTVILFLPLHQFHACILSAFGVAAQGCSIHRSFSCKGARGEVWDKICSLPFESTHSWVRRLCREHNSLLLRLEQEDSEVCIEVLKVCAAATLRISAIWLNHVLISMSGSLLLHTVLVSLGCLPLFEKQVCVCISVPPFLFFVLLSVMYAQATSSLNTKSLKKTKIN